MANNTTVKVSFPFLMILFFVFLVLKLCNVITWSWLWVTAPLWIGAILWVLVVAFVIFLYYVFSK